MKARRLIESASYEPEVVAQLCQAFDEAWERIAHLYGDPAMQEAARQRLATIVLAHGNRPDPDVGQIVASALQVMKQ